METTTHTNLSTTPDVAAIQLRVQANNGTHQDLTVVWSTIKLQCDCGHAGATTVQVPADREPFLWDASGCGNWTVAEGVQCGNCGQLWSPAWLVRDNVDMLDVDPDEDERIQAEIDALTALIAETVAENDDYDLRKLRESLREDAAAKAAELVDAARLDAEEEDPEYRTWVEEVDLPDLGSMEAPGVGRDGDELVAWDYDPRDHSEDPDMVEVRIPMPVSR